METFSIYKKIKKHLSDDELIDTISQRNAVLVVQHIFGWVAQIKRRRVTGDG